MEAIVNSTILVFVSEMGDKTQLLSLMLVARYKRPWVILAGVLVATLLNHALAALVGGWIGAWFSEETLRMILAVTFVGFGLWILVPDKEGELEAVSSFGVFVTTVIAFFMAEMGDKTQLATIALGARYSSVVAVTAGSTLGMLGSNALAVFLGENLLKRIPMKYVRWAACASFVAFGILIWVGK